MKVRNLIIGGGFAGLQLAAQLGEATIIESDSEVGGLLRSFKSESGQFTFDIGGHVYTSKDEALNELLEGAYPRYFEERKAFYDFDKMVPYPVQFHADKLGINLVSNRLQEYPSLAAMFKHEFGNQFYERIMGPFNKRVWSTNPNQMDADWVMGRVPSLDEIRAGWGPNSSFNYACGEDILGALWNKLEEVKVFTNTTVTAVDIDNKRVFVGCRPPATYKGIIEYERVFDTTGLFLKTLGTNLPHNRVLTIGVGLNRMIDADFHWCYNSVDNASAIHRITLLSRYHPKLAPSGTDSLLIEIPYPDLTNTGTKFYNDNVLTKVSVMTLLRDANFKFISEKDIEEVVSIDSKGYPIPVIAHRYKIAIARRILLEKDAFLVGRWGAHEYLNLDHIIKGVYFAIMASYKTCLEDYHWSNWYYKERRSF